MTDREWWNQLDQHGPVWRLMLAKQVGAEPTDAQLKKLLSSTSLDLYVLDKGGVLNLAPLARFSQLSELDIRGFERLETAAVVGKLASLRKLMLKEVGLEESAFLAKLERIEKLTLMKTRLRDLGALATLTTLKELILSYNDLVDLRPLATLTQLEKLGIAYNQVTDLSPLAGLVALRELTATENPFDDLTPLAGLTALVSLDVSGPFPTGKLTSVAPLSGLTKLEWLDLSCNQLIADLSPLKGCASLKTLNATGMMRKIGGFSELLVLKRLKEIRTHREIMGKADQAAFKKKRVEVSLD